MSTSFRHSFTRYYLSELARLEEDCAEYARSFPRIAGNLNLASGGGSDPHVRQVIEAVAFIAARLKRQIDAVPGELAYEVLRTLAPRLVGPIPSMSIVRFVPLSRRLEPVGAAVPAGLRLRARSPDGDCTFSAVSSGMRIWPLEVKAACGADAPDALDVTLGVRLEVDTFSLRVEHAERELAEGSPGELTFFIGGGMGRAMAAIEALSTGVRDIRMESLDGSWSRPLSVTDLSIPGFETSDRLLPLSDEAPHTSALLHEFVNFPRRFCFFRIRNLSCPAPTRGFRIVMSLEANQLAAMRAVTPHIALNCMPIVNVYPRSAVALPLKGERDEYPIARGDGRRGKWDVFAVQRVRLISQERDIEVGEFHPGVSGGAAEDHDVYWQGVRRDRARSDVGHASLSIRLANLDKVRAANFEVAMLDVSCTNCEAPETLRAGQAMEVQGWEGGCSATLEIAPSAYVPAPLPSDQGVIELLKVLQWRADGNEGLSALVRRHVNAYQRTAETASAALAESLDSIERRVVAMPWPGMPGAHALGCQYVIKMRPGGQEHGGVSEHLFARVIRRLLMQTNDLALPMDVRLLRSSGELALVD